MRLIIGADSKVGSALAKNWVRNDIEFHGTSRRNTDSENIFFDLSNFGPSSLIKDYDKIVLCAAITDMNYCENNPEKSYFINVDAVKRILEFFYDSKQIILLSSSQVFDGTKPFRKPYDKKNPINEYGKQKSVMEDIALAFENATILRLSKIVDEKDELFLNWKKDLLSEKEIYAFHDYSISATPIRKVVSKINALMEREVFGIFHCEGNKDQPYYEYAKDLAVSLNRSERLVKKISYKEKKFDYKLPRYVSLRDI